MPGAHKGCSCLYFANSRIFFFKLYLCFWMESHLSGGFIGLELICGCDEWMNNVMDLDLAFIT